MIRLLKAFFREPLAVEALVAVILVVALWLVLRSLRGVAARISRRKALKEFVSGVDSYFKGEFEDARDELLKVLERDPENSEARILLGDAYRALGDLAEAHKHHYQVARVFEQDLPRNHLSLGTDLVGMGRAVDAIPHLERAVAADPGDRGAAETLLQATLDAGELSRAVGIARQLTETAKGAEEKEKSRRRQARVFVAAGRDHLDRGEVREATQLLKSAVRLDQALVSARLDLVRSAFLHSSAEAAEKELTHQLRDMARLAEDGEVVFERAGAVVTGPSRRGGRSDTGAMNDAPGPPKMLDSAGAPADRPSLAPPKNAEGSLLPARRGDGGGIAAGSGAGAVPGPPLRMDAGSLVRKLLPREALYLCTECGQGALDYSELCAGCGAVGSFVAVDSAPMTPVPDMEEVFNEVLENRAFIRLQVMRAAGGDERAAEKLCRLGPVVVPGIFRAILRVEDDEALAAVLSNLGPGAVPKIMDAYRRMNKFSTKKLVRGGARAFRSLDDFVVRAITGMGPDAVAAAEPFVEGGSREFRQIALDVLIVLGRADRIEGLRLSLSTKEVLDRLNACPAERLGPLIDTAPPDGFLVSQVFPDRTFGAETALVRALERSENREKLRSVLMERGFSSEAYRALERVWGIPGASTIVTDVVRAYGRAASDHLIRTCTDESVPDRVRDSALRLLLDHGDEEVDRLVELLSEGDPETEQALLRVLCAFGNRAIPALVRCYGKTGLLHRVGLNRRRLEQRKIALLRAMREIGTYESIQGLRRLHDREGDPDLKRRISGVLSELEDA